MKLSKLPPITDLPDISTNLPVERLKRLEQQGLLRCRVLPPRAGSTAYELTPVGKVLEKTLLELGKWGSQFMPPSPEGANLLLVVSYALALKIYFRPEQAQGVNETYELPIDNEVLHGQIYGGGIQVRQGETRQADVIFQTEMPSYLKLLQRQIQPEEAVSKGIIRIEGECGSVFCARQPPHRSQTASGQRLTRAFGNYLRKL